MRTKMIDPLNNQTLYTYDGTGMFLSQVQYPNTGTVTHIENFSYDLNTGLLNWHKDQNSQQTSFGYDSMRRIKSVTYPDGGSETYCFKDKTADSCPPTTVVPSFVFTKAINSGTNFAETGFVDGFGRQKQIKTTVPASTCSSGSSYMDTTYDNEGRKFSVSNPYCTTSDTTYGLTKTYYDTLNRVTSVVEQDNSTVSTDYSAFPCITVTDEAGKKRKSCSDGLGRLTQVIEDPGISPHLNYSTTYGYDALDNLLSVTQSGSRQRTFTYDSVSRLTKSINPESNTQPVSPFTIVPTTYTYDANGNLKIKTSPAPNQTGTATVATNYWYDALNRMTYMSFSDGSYRGGFRYDQSTSDFGNAVANPIGRLTTSWQAYGGQGFSYDSMGRIIQVHRAIDSTTRYIKDLFYGYNLAGSVTSLTYPSGRVVNSTYDSAGHVLSAIDSSGTQYTSNATYWPNGALYQQWTPKVYLRTDLNNRLQIGRSYADNGLVTAFYFDKSYTYGAQNNGNILSITNNKDATRTQSFTYDPLNRLASAQNAGTDCTQLLPDGHTKFWGNTYGYDAWGNLLQEVPTKCSAENLSVTANSNNQLVGNSYDAAGNTTGDGLHSYTYDAGDLLKTVGTTTYWYDADGQRFQKWLNGSGSKTYWYGMGGEVLAEGDAAGHLNSEYVFFGGKRVARVDIPSGAVQYYLSDHLGSTSMVVSAAGAIENESEYYPWGRERQFSSSDGNHYKFNGKERDSESGLDYFGARYMSSQYGRFMTPDPKLPSVRSLINPQKWNKYAYTINNPLRYFDPDGMEEIEVVLRAFIPQRSVTDPRGKIFAGDNRGFSAAASASSRTTITVRIETDASIRPGNPIISVTPGSAGLTRQVDANGNTIASATATTGLPTTTGSRDASGNAVLSFQQNTPNPLEPQSVTPGIRANLDVNVTQNGLSVTTTGTVSGTPSFELNVGGTNIPLQSAPSGTAGFNYGLFNDNSIRNSTPLPPPPPPPPPCATEDRERRC